MTNKLTELEERVSRLEDMLLKEIEIRMKIEGWFKEHLKHFDAHSEPIELPRWMVNSKDRETKKGGFRK